MRGALLATLLAYTHATPLARGTASSYAGSQTSDVLPTPSNEYSSRVYALDQPYRGDVSDGALPHLAINPHKAVSYPYTEDYPSILVKPVAKDAATAAAFDVMENWGINMPYKSAPTLLDNTNPFPPPMCRIEGVNLLHRHAERYPSSWDQALDFAEALSTYVQKGLNESKPVEFLNELDFVGGWALKV